MIDYKDDIFDKLRKEESKQKISSLLLLLGAVFLGISFIFTTILQILCQIIAMILFFTVLIRSVLVLKRSKERMRAFKENLHGW